MIIYFHGFASSGKSIKSIALKNQFGEDRVIAPDFPADPIEVIQMVTALVHNAPRNEKVMFVGTSLGGFYALYCAQYFDAPCVIVNPSTRPSQTIAKHIGINQRYDTNEEFEVTDEHIETFKTMEAFIDQNSNGALVNLIVAHDDNVIDYRITLQDIPYRKRLIQFPDGGHRLTEHWDEVVRVVNDVLKA